MSLTRRIIAACLLSSLLLAAQSPTHIVVLHTNDLHGQVQPQGAFGGIAEIATIVRNNAADLILDAGDRFTGTLLNDEFAGEPIIEAMNRIGYHAGVVGNHEFDYGLDALRVRVRQATFPMITANLDTTIPEIKKYTIVTAKGIRFGIIGLTIENLRDVTHPKNVDGVSVQNVVKALEETLPEVRQQSDFIILLTHLTDDEEKRLAVAFPEIRLIIGGHNHTLLGPVWEGQTMIAKTGASGRNLGRIDLEFEGKSLKHIEGRLVPVTGIVPDPDINALLLPFKAKVVERMQTVIGESTLNLARSNNGESALANMIADAFRAAGKSEIAFHNIGGIRAPIAKGTITLGNVFEVLPFQNILCTLRLTGAQLKKVLNHNLIAVSGLRVRFDLGQPAGARLVSVVLSDGRPVEDNRYYTVTTNDFLVAGGDGFSEFSKGSDIRDTGIVLRDVLADYIRARRVIGPILDGRILDQANR